MQGFKKGDKVKRIKNHVPNRFIKGKIYTVTRDVKKHRSGVWITGLYLEEIDGEWFPPFFRKGNRSNNN